MRKAQLSPLSSHFYNVGNNEVQMPYLDVLMQTENKGNVNGEDAFILEPKIFHNDNQIKDGSFAIPYQSHFNSNFMQDNHETEFNDEPITVMNERKKSKRKKPLSSFEQQQSHQTIEEVSEINDFRLSMPVRRSQKLSDKITALQKLVSPYGKTDTASVLQETFLYIKLLQEQIQMLSRSYKSLRGIHAQEIGMKQQDLRSRGLCLVPISFTQGVTKEQ